jgi:type IV fimbrial biogenesis protein FimT
MHSREDSGATLIELMVAVAIIAVLLAVATPNFSSWLQTAQIRTATEAIVGGLQLARSEAVRRNASMRFQFTTTVDASCALSTTGTNWVVSQGDPAGKCNATPSDDADLTTDARIKQVRSSQDGTRNVQVASNVSLVTFTSLGQVTPLTAVTINVSNPTGGTCAASAGTMRCMRVQVSPGGQVRMCDPARTSTVSNPDPQAC